MAIADAPGQAQGSGNPTPVWNPSLAPAIPAALAAAMAAYQHAGLPGTPAGTPGTAAMGVHYGWQNPHPYVPNTGVEGRNAMGSGGDASSVPNPYTPTAPLPAPTLPVDPAAPPGAPGSVAQANLAAHSQLQSLDRLAPFVGPDFEKLVGSIDRTNPQAAWEKLSAVFANHAKQEGYADPNLYVAHLHDRADYAAGRAHASAVVAAMHARDSTLREHAYLGQSR